jgi:hypothetical protein
VIRLESEAGRLVAVAEAAPGPSWRLARVLVAPEG